MYDIYLGDISEKETIFINEIAPPLDVDPPTSPINLTAKRLDTRVFDLLSNGAKEFINQNVASIEENFNGLIDISSMKYLEKYDCYNN